MRRAFDWFELPAAPYELGPFRLSSQELPHFVPNAGVRLATPGPGNDRERSRAVAAEHFPGEILIADEGSVIPLA
ncbi:MAG TPA: hypothetical protein VK925_12770 [Jiangellaceae bacterium]|nr:hypothetical protein [Jiangellaceae bacterium]